jgi:hypothetical protein
MTRGDMTTNNRFENVFNEVTLSALTALSSLTTYSNNANQWAEKARANEFRHDM